MAIKLNNHTEGYENAKQKYAEVVKNEASTPEQIETAWNEMQAELVNSLKNQITAQISVENADRSVLAARGANVLTSTEIKFFNEVVQSDGFTSDVILPETTVDRIFEDLTTDHPLLAEINLQNAGLLTRIIKSETEGAAVWGKVFGEIKGQLDATFKEENISQSKLTAFVVLPKDLEKFGPAWVEAYVRAQIKETFAVALEKAFINGAGPAKDEPIGLIRDLEASVSPTEGHAKKAIKDTLTFATPEVTVKELSALMKNLSTKSNGKAVNVTGKVVLVVNPVDAWDVKALYTFLNANGVYVTVLPFNLRIVESVFQTQGELLAFVNSRYDAYTGGGVEIKKFDQTLAIEDCNLFTAKQFAFGKADDNKAAAIYTLNVATTEPAGA
ncbi:phage major capsid protein [Niallia taxi]|uniref:phage major capsid protein n=1 Tax=Niallia taxi TaxID=2499688 RepID=UPI003F603DD5